ncbi:MAG: type IX secretion system membrane protein PorP/SprF [Ferruginibacter sp.]
MTKNIFVKSCFIACFQLICLQLTIAQQKPHYTQYVLNNFALNPALSGIENYTDIKLAHRHQWVGFDGAPVTSYLTLNIPLGKKDYKTTATSFDIEGTNPLGERYWENYTASPAHHGLGLQFFNDKIGPFSDVSLKATYAYHMPLNQKTNLAAGIALGVGQISLNSNKLFFGNDFPVDPSVASSGVLNQKRINVDAGLWLYSADYFAGVSVLEILPQKIDFSGNIAKLTDGKWVPHIFATAGYRFMVSEDINAVPSVMVKYINPIPLQVEANLKLQYQNLLWVGGTYRHKYGFAAFAGMNVLNTVQVSYAYDYTTTRLNTVSKGTHEIMLGFIIGNKFSGETCPKNVW